MSKELDRELKALKLINETLGRLPADAARRIVAYLLSRYPNLRPTPVQPSDGKAEGERS